MFWVAGLCCVAHNICTCKVGLHTSMLIVLACLRAHAAHRRGLQPRFLVRSFRRKLSFMSCYCCPPYVSLGHISHVQAAGVARSSRTKLTTTAAAAAPEVVTHYGGGQQQGHFNRSAGDGHRLQSLTRAEATRRLQQKRAAAHLQHQARSHSPSPADNSRSGNPLRDRGSLSLHRYVVLVFCYSSV